MDIRESIIKNKPNLSTSSLRTYTTNIASTARDMQIPLHTTSDVVKHSKAILDSLSKLKTNTRKTKLAAFVVTLDGLTDKHAKQVVTQFRTVMNKDLEEVNNKQMNQELSDTQKDNYISWDEVMERYKQLENEVAPLLKMKTMTTSQQQKLQLYVLMSLYTMIPPRRSLDYTSMKVKNISKAIDNYITFGKAKSTLVFNTYKNAKRLGSQKVDIPKDLTAILKKYISKLPADQDYLIVNSVGKPVIQTFITKALNNFFGKKISSSMLRHIYLTKEFGDVDLKKLDATTQAMGNSEIGRSLRYISKEDAEQTQT